MFCVCVCVCVCVHDVSLGMSSKQARSNVFCVRCVAHFRRKQLIPYTLLYTDTYTKHNCMHARAGKLTADDTSIFLGLLNDLFPKTLEQVPRAIDHVFDAKVCVCVCVCVCWSKCRAMCH